MLLIVLAIALFTHPLHAAFSSCHNGCTCLKKFAICSETKSLKDLTLPINITTLVLDSLQLKTLPTDVFRSLGELSVLEIQGCAIESLEEGAFGGLENMEAITIAKCIIGNINRKAFSNMNNITRLTFSENVITYVRQEAFYNITNVTEITFQSNNFTNLARRAFHRIKSVKFFHFYLNTITGTMKMGGFVGMQDLGRVNIYLNSINFIECLTFDNLVLSGKKVSIYSNTFKCHCKLVWMLSQVSMKKYLSNNLCATNGDSKQVVLSSITIGDLHCSSAKHTHKQQGCPDDNIGILTRSSTMREKTKRPLPKHRPTAQMRIKDTKMSTVTVGGTNKLSYKVHVASMSPTTESAEEATDMDKKSLLTSTSATKRLTIFSTTASKHLTSKTTRQIMESLTSDSTRESKFLTAIRTTVMPTEEINLPMTQHILTEPSSITFALSSSTGQFNKVKNSQMISHPTTDSTCCVTINKKIKLRTTTNLIKRPTSIANQITLATMEQLASTECDQQIKLTDFQGQSLSGSIGGQIRIVDRGCILFLLDFAFFIVIW